MKYNPNIHHRKSIRLKGYDYSKEGAYFITICCHRRICRFGHVDEGEMILNDFGLIAESQWLKLPNRFDGVALGVFKIMPNHMHGIIHISENLNRQLIEKTNKLVLGDIIGAYKSLVVTQAVDLCNTRNQYLGKLWQRNYYEHIIRDNESYNRITNYIINNPANWRPDRFYS